MFHHPSIHILKRRYRLLIAGGLIGAALSFLPLLVMPLEYRADAEVFIITKTRYGVDPYTVVKSAERVAENIAAVMKTGDFFQKVMAETAYDFDRARFQNVSELTKRRRWQKAVQTDVTYGTGGLTISAYDKNPDKALALAGAAASAISRTGWEYVGGDVTIKLVNEPIVTRWPARPNALLNALLGLVAGIIAMAAVVMSRK